MDSLSKPLKGFLPALSLFFLLVISLYLTSALIENSNLFEEYRELLTGFIVLLLIIFALLILINSIALIKSSLKKSAGAKLTSRLVILTVVLMLIPALTVYWFSKWLVEEGVDSWFNADVESALDSSLELSRWSLDTRLRHLRDQAQILADEVSVSSNEMATLAIESFVEAEDSSVEVMLLRNTREIIASASKETLGSLMILPPEVLLREALQQEEPYVGLDPIEDDEIYMRIIFPVLPAEVLEGQRFLQVLYPVSQRIGKLSDTVEKAYTEYNRLLFLRASLKQTFVGVLTLVLFSGVLYAGWAAFYFARRLTRPIAVLDEGTQKVAAGDLDTRLPVTTNDEFGSLVESFNEMTRRLAVSQNNASTIRSQLEMQKSYLQTVLEHISSGVIGFNEKRILRTANLTATRILELNLDEWINKPLQKLAHDSQAKEFFAGCLRQMENNANQWNEQLEYYANEKKITLFCRGSHLPDGGYVIVVNDITDIVQAQRHRTWSEIAQRMAHEFKNPLTPIQLSAERLSQKLESKLDEENLDLLKRSTRVITQQVEAMRRIVDDFSQFAQAVPIDVREVDINDLVKDIIDLYLANDNQACIEFCPCPEPLTIYADAGRLRQLLHNLIINANEALCATSSPLITISTKRLNNNAVEIQVCDNGPGFSSEVIGNAFEPYITDKESGTGLGLSIVKRIVEEHNGNIQIDNGCNGAKVVVTLHSLTQNDGE